MEEFRKTTFGGDNINKIQAVIQEAKNTYIKIEDLAPKVKETKKEEPPKLRPKVILNNNLPYVIENNQQTPTFNLLPYS